MGLGDADSVDGISISQQTGVWGERYRNWVKTLHRCKGWEKREDDRIFVALCSLAVESRKNPIIKIGYHEDMMDVEGEITFCPFCGVNLQEAKSKKS